MFKQLVRLGLLVQVLLLIGVACFLWLPQIISPLPITTMNSQGPLFDLLYGVLKGEALISTIIAFLLITLSALLLNVFTVQNDLHPRNSLLIALFYFILMGWNSKIMCLTPILPASFLLIFSINHMHKVFGKDAAYNHVFLSSFYIALASLFYFPAIYFIVFVWLGLLAYNISSWREWAISTIGFLIPFIYMATFFFLKDSLSANIEAFVKMLRNYSLNFNKLNSFDLSFYIIALILILAGYLNNVTIMQDKVISFRKRASIMNNFVYICLPVLFLGTAHIEFNHLLIFIPLAFYLANSVVFNKNKKSLFDLFILFSLLYMLLLKYIK